MIELKTKIGSLFCEEPNAREEKDRLKIFDSKGRYFTYFSTDYIYDHCTIAEFITSLKVTLSKLSPVEKILDYFGIDSYSASIEWTDLLEDMYGHDGFDYKDDKIYDTASGEEITLETILNNEYVNVIGDTYIFVCE